MSPSTAARKRKPKVPPFSEAVRFHGHVCPKIVLGYRVAKRAMEELGFDRTTDEEIVAITLNDTCAVDAIQAVTGCTLGKGSLIFKDCGKMAFVFINRDTGKAVRISEAPGFEVSKIDPLYYELRGKVIRGEATEEEAAEVKRRSAVVYDMMLHMPDEELLVVKQVEPEVPERARLFTSVRCEACGEKMAESRARLKDGKIVCLECFDEYGRGW
ncbi:FmdE family protein [Methanocella sp. MCL-LM]|uniref:FmdE family protein n=1 Tax=Methanocella sp. MCL-LM TaxID=3412035 RepID=UPI003C71B5D8